MTNDNSFRKKCRGYTRLRKMAYYYRLQWETAEKNDNFEKLVEIREKYFSLDFPYEYLDRTWDYVTGVFLPRKKLNIDLDYLKEKVADGYSIKDLSKIFKCHPNAIKKYLKNIEIDFFDEKESEVV